MIGYFEELTDYYVVQGIHKETLEYISIPKIMKRASCEDSPSSIIANADNEEEKQVLVPDPISLIGKPNGMPSDEYLEMQARPRKKPALSRKRPLIVNDEMLAAAVSSQEEIPHAAPLKHPLPPLTQCGGNSHILEGIQFCEPSLENSKACLALTKYVNPACGEKFTALKWRFTLFLMENSTSEKGNSTLLLTLAGYLPSQGTLSGFNHMRKYPWVFNSFNQRFMPQRGADCLVHALSPELSKKLRELKVPDKKN